MVGPSMRPPRSISGSSSAAAAAAVAMAMATVANARLSACGGANGLGGGGGYNFEGGPLDQDVNPTTFRNTSHHNNHHQQADDLSARGSEATSSRSVELPTTAPAGALSYSHRKLHAYSSPSPTIPPPSRGTFPLGAPSPTEHLSGHARTLQSPQLSIATTSRYISSTPTPGAHEMVSDSKRLAGYDYFNLPLTQSAASTPSVASPSFTTQTRSFAQLSLLDDSSVSASLPPTPTQSHFEKYGEGFDPSSLYKAPVPLYPTQTSQPPHRLSGQLAPPVQHNKQLRTTSISPHPQGSRDFRHQPFGFPDRRSSLPWDARISSHFGSLESRGSGGTKGGFRQQHGSSTISSASTIPGYKGRERHSLPQSLLVRSNSTPAIFGLPSTPMTTLEQHQQQQLQQVHINTQQGWNAIRPKVECDMNAASTTNPSTIVERIAPQDLLAAPGGHCSSTFERPFHNNNTQGQQAVMQGIQKSTPRGSISSTTGGVPRQQEQQQIRVQRSFSQEDTHQQQQQQQAGEPWASLTGLDTFEGSMSADTQLHRPTGHPLVFDTIGNERNDAASQQQQQQQQPYQDIQHHQHLPQSAQHGQQHPLSLKVEDLDDDNFDSSLAMVLDDHLSLMDHLSMMPNVEVYQSHMPNAAVPMMRSAELHQQQAHKIIIPSSSSGPSGGHHPHHYRFQGPMSAPAISAHHQNLFGTSDLYPSSTTTSTSNTAVRSNGYTVMPESSIPSPVSPEDPTTALGGGGSLGLS
ncbi:hypothetical protein BGX24_008048 [Mortierella sp. AD032]|nr:hypothetical protein BGX24_008048 [Mortierella sp. AD032]